MKRGEFIKICCYSALSVPFVSVLQSCETLHFAKTTKDANKLIVARSEFWKTKKDKKTKRKFVLIKTEDIGFPICLYNHEADIYTASLLKCTHRGCELNVGGGIYSCPCHGSEFSTKGKVLEGPANKDLQTFKTAIDSENIYIYLP